MRNTTKLGTDPFKRNSAAREIYESLTWDAFDRLAVVSQRDTNGNGFDWTACYDPLGRRMETRCHMVLSNTVMTGPVGTSSTIDSWYDPEVEFGEVGVQVNGIGYWKTLGPDISGVYGGMQGVGGVESVWQDGESNSVGIVQDYFGNVIGTINVSVTSDTSGKGSHSYRNYEKYETYDWF